MRMTKFRAIWAAVMAAFFFLGAQAQDLPVKKVVLYKNGLGYFEHDGRVNGNQKVEIVLPSRQLDDVLKSLTVIDRGRGQIAGVTYDSSESLDRRLSELPVQVNPSQGLVDFLNKIPGAEVEVVVTAAPVPATVTGRLMGAEIRQKKSGEYIIGQSVTVNVLTAKNEVRAIELPSQASLKLLKPELARELRDYLTVLDSAHQRDSRRLQIQANGTGERSLLVSYTAEAPIWKTTYRLVLDDTHKPLLQGWAIVDNTTANEWQGVELSLVAGQPVSFIQNLSQPLYGRRAVIPLAQGLEVTPQTHQATLEIPAGASGIAGVVMDASGATIGNATVTVLNDQGGVQRQLYTGSEGRFSAELDPGGYRIRVEARGFKSVIYPVSVSAGRATALNPSLQVGSLTEAVEVHGQAPTLQTEASSIAKTVGRAYAKPAPPPPPAPLGDMIREGKIETATAQSVGDQFEYKIRQPVTIHRNQSALLPIINSDLDGEKVVLYNEASGDRRPRFAVWVKNSSNMTLDSGSFSVIDGSAFAGEGLTEAIHPGERRLLSYALDSGLQISSNRASETQRVEKVVILHGVMTHTRQLREKKTYVIRNNDDKARVIVVEHPARAGWTLVDTPAPTESSAGLHRFRVEARPKATIELVIQETNPQQSTYELSNVDSDDVGLWVKEKTIDAATEKLLREVVRRKEEVEALNTKGESLNNELEAIEKDQGRLRDNLGKLNAGNKDEASLRQRYIKQMEQQEDRLAQIKAEAAKLTETVTAAQKSLNDFIGTIAIGN